MLSISQFLSHRPHAFDTVGLNIVDIIRLLSRVRSGSDSLIMLSAILAAIIALLVGVVSITNSKRKTTSSLPLPPGPKPLPVIGNVHQAPKSHAWRTYLQWSKEYGPIVHVNMLGQSVVILSSSEVAHDLLAKRGAVFSDRPRLFVRTPLISRSMSDDLITNVGLHS